MNRNVGLKHLSVIVLLACGVLFAAPDKSKTDPDHNSGGSDGARGKIADKSPEISKVITEMKRLTESKTKVQVITTLDKDKPLSEMKDVYPADMSKVISFMEEAKHFVDGLSACGNSDNHAFDYKELVNDKCLKGVMADGFIQNLNDEMAKWTLRGGSADPIRVSQSRLLQCRQSIEDVKNARKEAKVNVDADEAMLKKFDEVLAIFEFKLEDLKKREPGEVQKNIIASADLAKKHVTAKSCSVSKLKDKDNNESKAKKKDKEDKEDSNEEDKDESKEKEKKKSEPTEEEKQDPPALKPIPRPGPTAAGVGGDNGGNGARDGQQQPVAPPQGQVGGLPAGFDGNANLGNNPFLNPLDFANLLREPPDQSSRVGGSPSNTRGAPSFQAPSIQPGGGQQGGQPEPQQQQQPQPQQQQGPMPMPQQQPIVIGDPNSNSKSNDPQPKTATPAPGPTKEDLNAAEKKGFQDGYNRGLGMMQQMPQGAAQGAQAGNTQQKLTAANFGRRGGGNNARNARRGNSSRSPGFSGTSQYSVSGRRTNSGYGRGSMQ